MKTEKIIIRRLAPGRYIGVADAVYAFVDSGELDGTNRGTGAKRYVVFGRSAIKAFLAKRRTGV